MPQFLIFDNHALKDSRGNDVDMNLDGTAAYEDAVRSMPVRLFGAQNVGFQFVCAAPELFNLFWCMEFFADNPSLQQIPNARTWPGIPPLDPAWPWAREQIEEMTSGGHINHFHIERQMEMGNETEAERGVDARYFPMKAYGLWVRLALWLDGATLDPETNLYVFATEGGYDQETAAENSLVPWAG